MFGFNVSKMFVIRRRKFQGLVWHYGLLLPEGLVAEFSEGGVRLIPVNMFSAGMDVETMQELSPSTHFDVRARLDAARRNPRQYDLLQWNCETFINWLIGEEPRSVQVRWVAFVAAVAGLVFAFSRS
ncbi:hypothetical protein [Polaromonas sp. JS666]|uniref:hypothetical protein n=1 Tax=Polaromonas sp. (strain JS666 / ATCC BAA-500) TaxID=296591 RepID=UPI0008835ACA|nr:hypothetical protein [Polaromonas sp. JS666]SDM42911.1 hypothetical protein SAMN05720382_101316 [Polaromonas sp. JS666]